VKALLSSLREQLNDPPTGLDVVALQTFVDLIARALSYKGQKERIEGIQTRTTSTCATASHTRRRGSVGERGINVDHMSVYRWVQRITPLLIDAARRCLHAPSDRDR
jgi:hypothetical protein